MPSTRPLTRMKKAEATPSRMPPDNEAHGVKLAQSIVMTHSFSETQNCSYSTCITASALGLVNA
jgi:hypothetical protein